MEWSLYLYIVGAIPGGFTAGYLYKKFAPNETKYCALNLVASSLVLPLPVCIVMISLNILERFNPFDYQSTKALPFEIYVKLFFAWLIFVVPVTVLSGILGRNLSNNPLIERSRIQRELPKNPNCLARPKTLTIISGLIQFIPFCIFYVDTLEGIWIDKVFNNYLLLLL